MTIPTENLDAMIQFLTDVSETSGDHFMRAADMLRAQQARIAELERGSPRCECCGYLVHHREHLGCIRAAYKMAELEAQAAIGRRAVDVLQDLEWPVSRLTGEKYCPNCGQYASHDSACELAAILRDAEQAGMGVEL